VLLRWRTSEQWLASQ